MVAATRMNSFLGGNKCILPIIKLTGSLSCGLRVVSAISNGRCWFEFGLGVGVCICVKKSAFLGKKSEQLQSTINKQVDQLTSDRTQDRFTHRATIFNNCCQ